MDPHALPSSVLPNLRDLGGRAGPDGWRVAPGRVFRSGEPADPAVADDEHVASLALATVVDLRTAAERAYRPDQLPAGVDYLALDVLADVGPQAAALQAGLMSGPPGARSWDGFDPVEQMRATYRDLVVGASARAGYAAFVRAVVASPGPVLVHCTAGKDRTGWAATLLLRAAGVDEDEVLAEYLAVAPAVEVAMAPMLARLVAAGAPAELIAPTLQVRPEYLAAALQQVEDVFGTFEAYLSSGLGLSDEELTALRGWLEGVRG